MLARAYDLDVVVETLLASTLAAAFPTKRLEFQSCGGIALDPRAR